MRKILIGIIYSVLVYALISCGSQFEEPKNTYYLEITAKNIPLESKFWEWADSKECDKARPKEIYNKLKQYYGEDGIDPNPTVFHNFSPDELKKYLRKNVFTKVSNTECEVIINGILTALNYYHSAISVATASKKLSNINMDIEFGGYFYIILEDEAP